MKEERKKECSLQMVLLLCTFSRIKSKFFPFYLRSRCLIIPVDFKQSLGLRSLGREVRGSRSCGASAKKTRSQGSLETDRHAEALENVS